MVSLGMLLDAEYERFMENIETVGSKITHDFDALDRQSYLLARYGHLRPGTYDILR
jgi:hypothetical protein